MFFREQDDESTDGHFCRDLCRNDRRCLRRPVVLQFFLFFDPKSGRRVILFFICKSEKAANFFLLRKKMTTGRPTGDEKRSTNLR